MRFSPTFPISGSRPSPGAARIAGTLAASVLVGSALVACGSSQDAYASATTWTAPGSDIELKFADELPDQDPGRNFQERVWYPVRDGDADSDQNWADIYLPEGNFEDGEVPLVILVHGGGWHGGAPGVRNLAQDLSDRGVAVYNLEYRDYEEGGGYPKTFTDVADALDIVPDLNERFPEISIDDETVVGHSAGAQLAAWAGTRSDRQEFEVGADPKFTPTRVVSLAGPLDLAWAAEHGDDNIVKAMSGTPTDMPEEYASIDPIKNINPDVPVVAVHGTDDDLVPKENSIQYVAAVDEVNGNAELVLLDGEKHASFIKDTSDHYQNVLDIITGVATSSRDKLEEELVDEQILEDEGVYTDEDELDEPEESPVEEGRTDDDADEPADDEADEDH